MIKYALRCTDHGHAFEAWFRSSADFETQVQANLVTCPVCASTAVAKALMAPFLAKSGDVSGGHGPMIEHEPLAPTQEVQHVTTAPVLPPEAVAALRELREKLTANSDDVGASFPEEARKMHYGEAEPRGIHGHASMAEAKALIDEGIELMPLPVLPEDFN